jgi:hypothetical protein
MDYEQISQFPLYLRIKWGGFNAKVGRTHFLSAIELICHGAMWTGNEQRFLGTVSGEALFFGNQLEKAGGGRDGKSLKYDFKGAIYDRISEESIWYGKTHNTRNRMAHMARKASDIICRDIGGRVRHVIYPLWTCLGPDWKGNYRLRAHQGSSV